MKIQRKEQVKQKKRFLWKKIRMIFGFMIILLISLGLIFNKQLTALWVSQHSQPHVYKSVSAKEMQANQKSGEKAADAYDPNTVVPVSPENVAKAQASNKKRYVTGGIQIPALGINLPIYANDSYDTMLLGAGQMKARQVMGQGNYALASHDMWTSHGYISKTALFTPLKRAQKGQLIYLTNNDQTWTYKIDTIEQINPDEGSKALSDVRQPVVTLITCDTDADKRVMVRRTLVN